MLVAAAATLAATATYGVWIVRHGADRPGPALGRCAVSSTHAISVDPEALGLQVVARGDAAWVLLSQGAPAGAGARVQVVHMPGRGPATRTDPVDVAGDPRGDLPADLVLTPEGPTLVFADAARVASVGPLVPGRPAPGPTELHRPPSPPLGLTAALSPSGRLELHLRRGASIERLDPDRAHAPTPLLGPSVPAEAPLQRYTLAALPLGRDGVPGPAWGTTLSEAPPEAPGCLPGAFAALSDTEHRPVALPGAGTPLANARSLLDPSTARCGDRVLSAAWRGSVVAATLRRASGQTLAVQVDLATGTATDLPLDPHPAVSVTHPAVSVGDRGTLALWVDPVPQGPRIRSRMFRPDGAPWGPAETLGEVMTAPSARDPRRPMPLAYAGSGRWVAVFSSARGPRLARIHCGE